jgi:hypothetical protein
MDDMFTPEELATFQSAPDRIADWLRGCPDEWLVKAVERMLASPQPWSLAIAVGLIIARREPDSPKAARAFVERVRAGLVSLPSRAPREWARDLPTSVVRRFSDDAANQLQALVALLDHLSSTFDTEDEEWRGKWQQSCFLRDDLAVVRVLLRQFATPEALDRELDRVDREGRTLRLDVPARASPSNERLRRAALTDPDAWWGSLT